MGFKDLPDIHTRRHAQRIEHDVNRVPSSRNGISSIGRMRLITPLFPCRPAILSPGCNLRFTATKTLTILIRRGKFVAPFELFLTVLELLVDDLGGFIILRFDCFNLRLAAVIGDCKLEPFEAFEFVEDFLGVTFTPFFTPLGVAEAV